MAARMIVGTLGGAASALALMASSPVMAKQRDSKALTGPAFHHEGLDVAAQDLLVARASQPSSGSKPAGSFPIMEEPRTSPIATRHLILVRHGQEESQRSGLTTTGREQASLAGKRLSEMDLPFTKIVHNGQRRSAETSNMIASYLPDVRRESDRGLQQESTEEAVKKYLATAPVQQTGDSYVVVVCDEDMIKSLVSKAMNLSSKNHSLKLQLHHASVSMLAVQPDGNITVRALGDTGYMTKEHFQMIHS